MFNSKTVSFTFPRTTIVCKILKQYNVGRKIGVFSDVFSDVIFP